MKKSIIISLYFVFAVCSLHAQEHLTIRGEDDNLLMQVNDESGFGSITLLPSQIGVGAPTNKLYNFQGYLFFNGKRLSNNWISSSLNSTSNYVYYNLGNVGIGTNSPNTELDVNGTISATNLDASGTITATNLKINQIEFPDGSIQTTRIIKGVYTVSTGDFVSRTGSGVKTAYSNGLNGSYLPSGTEFLIAPFHLPQGAVITKVSFYGYDLHNTNINISLQYAGLQSSGSGSMASHTSNVSNGAYSGTDSTINNATINNKQRRYFVQVKLVGGTWHSQGELAVNAVVIEYDIP